MGRRVLLTGATGLIGRQCIAPLEAMGHEVLAVSRSGRSVAGASGIALDLLDSAAVAETVRAVKADALLHLAWHDHPKDRWTSPANLDWAAATLRLVRDFAEAGGTRVVAVGSCAEYEWTDAPLAETAPLKPASLYGSTKAATGLALTAAAPAMEISLAWARIFFCYGPGEPKGRLLGDLITGLSKGEPVDCTDGLQVRDFLHTGDIGRALAATLESAATGAINVARGEGTEVREIIETVARLLGAEALVRLGARPRPAGDAPLVVADAARLHAEVGFRPEFDHEAGLADLLRAEGVL